MAISEFPKWQTLFHLQKKNSTFKIGIISNEKCKLSEILSISLFAISQLKNAKLL